MTFPIDQFTSLPPAANAQPRGTAENNTDRSYNRPDQAAQDVHDSRSDTARSARDLASDLANERSDFQRHLDDQAANEQDRSAQAPEERDTVSPRHEDDQDGREPGPEEENNHGYSVSEIAKETASTQDKTTGPVGNGVDSRETPSGTDTVQDDKVSAGQTIRAVASSKAATAAVNTDAPATVDTATPEVSASTQNSEPALPEQSKEAGTPVQGATTETSASDETGNAATSASTPSVTTPPASTPDVTTKQTGPAEDVTVDQTSAASASDTTTQDSVVAAATEPETATPAPAETTAGATTGTEGTFNENAQKTEGAERPGWGAQNAPRSETGTQARELKSGNAALASPGGASTAEATSPEATSQKTPSSVAVGEPSLDETGKGSGEQGDETTLAEGLIAGQTNQDQTVTQQDTPFGTAANAGKSSAADGDAAKTGVTTPAEPVVAKSAAGTSAPSSGEKSGSASQVQANIQANAQPGAQTNAQAPSGATPGATGEQTAQAGANAASNASPTGVAKALASGQGSMPLGSAPSAEEVQVALGGIDKRGTRNGAKSDFTPGNPAAEASSKATAGGKTSAGAVAGTASTNQAAQSQASQGQTGQSTTTQSQPAQFAQATPAMPDPSALTSGTDMSMARGGASMEVDPVTGALHMTGTGSAKMAGPNLSEVTMQFSRARMIQTPAKDIAVQIAKHLSDGVNRFNIRISPPEMGRIEVRLEITDGGKVTAQLVADKPETLELLQKDRATLEKALAEAGLDTDADTLGFSMREGKEGNDEGFKNHGLEVADEAADGHDTIATQTLADLEVSAYGFDIVRMKRLDISI